MWRAAILIFGLLLSSGGYAKSLRQSAAPIGDPRDWEFKDDYPSRAMREQIGGTASYRLTSAPMAASRIAKLPYQVVMPFSMSPPATMLGFALALPRREIKTARR